MPVLTPPSVREQIATGETAPLYLLLGADDTETAAMALEFADMVDEGLRAFNVDHLYGGEIKADDLIEAAATLPMMVPRRIVIVHDGERLLIPRREGKTADAEQDRLESFVKKPPGHATVIFVCTALDQRRRLVKLLLKEAQVVDCGSLEDGDTEGAERWVRARAERDKVPLDASAIRALVQRAGTNIVRLRSGLERVALYALGQTRITAEDVRQVVPATGEAADFGIANAIAQNDLGTALEELALALEGGAAPFFLMGQIRWAAEKLPQGRLKGAIEAVFRTDLALKSSTGDPRILLERLVVELCEPKGGRSPRSVGAPGKTAPAHRRG